MANDIGTITARGNELFRWSLAVASALAAAAALAVQWREGTMNGEVGTIINSYGGAGSLPEPDCIVLMPPHEPALMKTGGRTYIADQSIAATLDATIFGRDGHLHAVHLNLSVISPREQFLANVDGFTVLFPKLDWAFPVLSRTTFTVFKTDGSTLPTFTYLLGNVSLDPQRGRLFVPKEAWQLDQVHRIHVPTPLVQLADVSLAL